MYLLKKLDCMSYRILLVMSPKYSLMCSSSFWIFYKLVFESGGLTRFRLDFLKILLFFRRHFFPPSGDTYLVILPFLILAVTVCLDPLIQETPTSQPSTDTSSQISSSIRLEIKYTIYVMHVNHPQTFPPHPWYVENCLHEIGPWCRKAWGPLLSFWVTRQWYSNSISYFFLFAKITKKKRKSYSSISLSSSSLFISFQDNELVH